MKSLPHWLAIVLVILPAPAISSPININLYLSESMGESTLIQLLQSVEPAESMNIVLRGMATNDRNLIQTITRWQSRIQSAGVAQGVQLNPVTFREHNIERVPAITITDNGSSELIVFGVTSVDWALRQYHAGRRGNIGTYGSTYPISEPDLLEVLLHRLQQQDWNSIQRKAQRRLEAKRILVRRTSTNQQAVIQQAPDTGLPVEDAYDGSGYKRQTTAKCRYFLASAIP